MEVVYRSFIDIVLKDKYGKELVLRANSFEEVVDELKVRTQIKNEELQRGWIGDFSYTVSGGRELSSGDDIDNYVEDSFKNVLLSSVKIWSSDVDEAVVWEYTFLKK